jgi:large subunit ribosomal protein L1
MAKLSKRTKSIQTKVEKKEYRSLEALKLLKEMATAKFIESAEAHISLKLDTKYADQQLRTTLVLPKGTGKDVRIAVVASNSIWCRRSRVWRPDSKYNERDVRL